MKPKKRRKIENSRYLRQYLKQNWKCEYCNIKMTIWDWMTQITIDHIQPFSQVWNSNLKKNICLCCEKCNHLKWNISVEMFLDWYISAHFKPWINLESFNKQIKVRWKIKWYQKLFPKLFNWNNWITLKAIKLY